MMDKKIHYHNFSSMHCQDHENNHISTQTIGNESPLCHLLPYLPYELIYNILLRIPVRSLMQFKCVCKSWKALISDSQFAKDHLFTSISDPNMTHHRFVYGIHKHRDIVSFSVQSLLQNPSNPAEPRYLRMSHRYDILGSLNGLLCLSRYKQGYIRLKLWNPCTGLKSKRLLIRYYANKLRFHGLGYDHVNNRYKVITCVEERGEIETKIYSFGSNSCTVIHNQNFPRLCTRRQGKFVSGTLNWIVKRGKSVDQWVILSLDMVTEIFGEMFLPKVDENGDKIWDPVLGVSRNCLCIYFFDSKNSHWNVLLMKEYGVRDSWIKLVITPHIDLLGTTYHPMFEPLYISENGIIVLRTIMHNHHLIMHNLKDVRLGYPRIRGKLGINVHIYIESLVSPKC